MDKDKKIRKLGERFSNAIAEVDALVDYYVTFKNAIAESRLKIESEYRIGAALSEIFDSIVKNEGHDRDLAIEAAKTKTIEGTDVEDIVEIFAEQKSDTDRKGTLRYSLKGKYRANEKHDPSATNKKLDSVDNQRKILVRSVLTNIIIIFEMYLANVYEFFIFNDPHTYFEGATIKVSDLFTGNSIGRIVSEKMRQEVSNNMFDSLDALDKIKGRSKIDVDRYIPIRKEFEEIYYRRNVFIHNNGVANRLYLSKVDEAFREDIGLNDKLVCDDVYLNNAISVLKKMICALLYEMLNSIAADGDDFLVLSEDVGFYSLKKGDYSAAEHIFGILKSHKESQFIDKTLYQVNYMIALKQQGKPIDELLRGFDTSAMKTEFEIAKQCLQENHDKVYELLTGEKMGIFPAMAIRDWPLFIDFRKTEYYERFKAEHIDDFNEFLFEPPEATGNTGTEQIGETVLSIQ